MEQRKWLCMSCNKTGVCAYFELSDMVHLPDITLAPSHHTVSPDCATKRIRFMIDGQVFEWTGGGNEPKEPKPAASLLDFVLAEDVLRLITLYEQKVVVVDSRKLVPKARAQSFRNAARGAGREAEILVYEGLPHKPGKLFFSRIRKHVIGREHVVIFVGGKGVWKRWRYMLRKQRRFSLLHRSVRFEC